MQGLIFDLDGTLVDTAYLHVLAWQRAFTAHGLDVPASALHPLIGLSGTLLVDAVGRTAGRAFPAAKSKRLGEDHLAIYRRLAIVRPPLPGAIELLRYLRGHRIRHGIATSGRAKEIAPSLQALRLPASVVVVDGDQVDRPKPSSDPVLACVRKLQLSKEQCYFVGDSIWDQIAAQRAGMCAIGVLTGGRSSDELAHAGAHRVFRDPQELLGAIHELGLS